MYTYIKQIVGSIWKSKKLKIRASIQPVELFRTCNHCPLDVFIKCLVDSDLTSLVKSGQPSIGDIVEAWTSIYYEYIDLNKDNEVAYILNLQKQISLLHQKIEEVSSIVKFLEMALEPQWTDIYRPELVEILKGHGLNYAFDLNIPDQYRQNLETISIELSSDKLNLEMLSKEYTDYLATHEDSTIKAEYFETMLIRLAHYKRVMIIRTNDLTVKEFVLLVKDYQNYLKLKTKTNGNKGENI